MWFCEVCFGFKQELKLEVIHPDLASSRFTKVGKKSCTEKALWEGKGLKAKPLRMFWDELREMRSQPVLCRACGRDWSDKTSQNGKSTLVLGCFQGLGPAANERNSIVKIKKTTFIPFILLTAKVYAKPVLKIFALAACAEAFFLLSANICQATFRG